MTEQFSLSGRLQEILFPELLLMLSDRVETGVLRLQNSRIQKYVYFQDGKIVFTTSNDSDERLGHLLLRRKKITYRQLINADAKVVPGKRLGTILVLEGHITPTELYHGVIDQIKEILYDVFEWVEGDYEFFPGPLPTDEVITLNLSTPDLILDGISRIWRWSSVKKGSISLAAVFRKREGWSKVVRKMTMTRDIQLLIDLLDRPRTLEEILQSSEIGNFETCRLVWGLLAIGIAEQILSAPPWVAMEDIVQFGSTTVPFKVPDVAPPAPETAPLVDTEAAETGPPTAKVNIIEQDFLSALQPDSEKSADILSHPEPPIEEQFVDLPPAAITEKGLVQSVLFEEGMPSAEPAMDLSFSDLSSLTDESLEAPAIEVAYEKWEEKVPEAITKFNECHRYMFEMLRLELGAGVTNFLTKIVKRASAKYPMVFDGVRMDDFGEFEKDSLGGNIVGNLFQNYPVAFRFLLDEECSALRTFLDKKRAEYIESGLARLAQKQQGAR